MYTSNNQNWFGVNHHEPATPPSMINHHNHHTSTANISTNNLHQMNGNIGNNHNNNLNNLHNQTQSHQSTNMSTNQNIYLRKRSVSNSNPALDRPAPAPDIPIQVEYEVSVPFVSTYRHTPYHSLWDLHEWWVMMKIFC